MQRDSHLSTRPDTCMGRHCDADVALPPPTMKAPLHATYHLSPWRVASSERTLSTKGSSNLRIKIAYASE